MLPDYRILDAGDAAIVVEFGDRIDPALNVRVNALDESLLAAEIPGIIETIPTFRSLMIHFEPLILGRGDLVARLAELSGRLSLNDRRPRQWLLPICYAAEMAPDLPEVARLVGKSVAEIVELHSSVNYRIYMLGFLPGQPYLGDNPPELVLPRRPAPRPAIPGGSVAIAMSMTSIFPQRTPCGWHLIARCPIPMWMWMNSSKSEPLLSANDEVVFKPISEREYNRLHGRAADGQIDLTPEGLAAECQA